MTPQREPVALLSLPAELLVTIANKVEPADSRNLRLVDRGLCRATDDKFLGAYFKCRLLVFSEDGLQALIGITSRKHLLRKLRGICIFDVVPKIDMLHGLADLFADHETQESPYRAWFRRNEEFWNSGKAYSMLWQIFQNIKDADCNPPKVILADFSARLPSWVRIATDGLERLRCINEVTSDNSDRAFVTLLRAVANSSLTTTEIGLWGESRIDKLQETTLCLAAEMPMRRGLLYERLTFLALRFRRGSSFYSETSWALRHMLEKAVNLKGLQLSEASGQGTPGPSFGEENPLNWLLGALKAQAIERLQLLGFAGATHHFKNFVRKYRGTLKQLKLEFLRIPMDDCWTEVLVYVSEDTRIAHFDARYVSRGLLYLEVDGKQQLSLRAKTANDGVGVALHAAMASGVSYEGFRREAANPET